MTTQRYRNDGAKRRRLFVPDAFQHPAKGHIAMWEEMVLRYSKEGDVILDPMAGIGTSLVAALMGRNVVCVEIEPHFVDPMRRSWAKMQTMPMLGYQMGQAVILRGDARCLPLVSADVVITSPPFEGVGVGIPIEQGTHNRWVIPGQTGRESDRKSGYTRPVDAIVTSPPFQNAETRHQADNADRRRRIEQGLLPKVGDGAKDWRYNNSTTNIGNQRGDAYWDSMRQVYAECWRVLRPGGIMALVLKGFTREGRYVDLPGQTEALLLEAGWQKHDHWRRELWSLSFWRILQKRRDPAAFDERLMYEEVLAFRKPEGQGRGSGYTRPPR
jgi:DNA modification methylase